ncbi:hypothetical protein AAE478_001776 [Parahypoxylon ruwenzoriense]
MSCGHVLTHYTQRCPKPCPDSEVKLDAPRAYIPDTCARCDPDYNAGRIQRAHAARRDQVLEQLYRASSVEGAERRQKEVKRCIARLDVLKRNANAAVGRAKHPQLSSSIKAASSPFSRSSSPSLNPYSYSPSLSALDVQFPRAASPKVTTSTWINGKCVWEGREEEEERVWRPGTHRIKKVFNTTPVIEESEEELSRTKRPPRLRSTKKGYIDPFAKAESSFAEEQETQLQVPNGAHRLRTNNKYQGPRDNAAFFEEEAYGQQQEHLPQEQQHHHHRLRRIKGYSGLDRHGDTADRRSTVASRLGYSEEQYDDTSDSDLTIHPAMRARKTGHVEIGGEEIDEDDIWLQLADKQQ